MLRSKDRSRGLTVAAVVLTALLLDGCAQMRSFISGQRGSPVAGEAGYYLQDIQDLAAGDAARQAEVHANARTGVEAAPGPQSNLKYALVLATPGHPETNLDEAQSMLREILIRTGRMTADETALARIYLRSVEQMLELRAEALRLRESTSNAATSRETDLTSQLAIVEAENLRLRRELEDALEKLEAIESIERSIRDQ